jgi:hypothetical protein
MLAICFIVVYCLAYSSTLKKEATYSTETLVDFQRTTRRHIPQYRAFHIHRCENAKSFKDVNYNVARKGSKYDRSGPAVYCIKCLRPLKILGQWFRIPLEIWKSVCFFFLFVLLLPCVGSGLEMGSSLVQGVLPSVHTTDNFRIIYC